MSKYFFERRFIFRALMRGMSRVEIKQKLLDEYGLGHKSFDKLFKLEFDKFVENIFVPVLVCRFSEGVSTQFELLKESDDSFRNY